MALTLFRPRPEKCHIEFRWVTGRGKGTWNYVEKDGVPQEFTIAEARAYVQKMRDGQTDYEILPLNPDLDSELYEAGKDYLWTADYPDMAPLPDSAPALETIEIENVGENLYQIVGEDDSWDELDDAIDDPEALVEVREHRGKREMETARRLTAAYRWVADIPTEILESMSLKEFIAKAIVIMEMPDESLSGHRETV